MHMALFLSGLSGGGAQRRMLTLARAFVERGHRVSLLPVRGEGAFRDQVPPGVSVTALGGPLWHWPFPALDRALTVLIALPALIRRLSTLQPDVILATSEPANVGALMARALGRLALPVVIVVNMDHTLALARRTPPVRALLGGILGWAYRTADAVVAISEGTSRFVRTLAGLPADRVTTIFNPVDSAAIAHLAAAPAPHPWLEDRDVPVVLAVGKLKPQKDYPTLIRAFALAHTQRAMRLMVLGEGELRPGLEGLVQQLGLAQDVAFEGFTANPFAYLARASVLILASVWEGLSNVLLEALACGCPIVSTDCPSGPREILDGGRYGELVTVGDAAALAEALLRVLDRPQQPEQLRVRARAFSVASAADRYLGLIEAVVTARHGGTGQLTRDGPGPSQHAPRGGG